ncbi:MAG: tetratricopeptide repeat protein [Desulfobacteraceae bacterium]|nr:tetratricopeptide repeat protein [Desulfobacteraceae bacterium]
MAIGNPKFEVSDPGLYDALISDQKKKISKSPSNATDWVELGRLQDAKAQLTNRFAQKNLMIRWLPVATFMMFASFLYFYIIHYTHSLPWVVMVPALVFCFIILTAMTVIRYPRSGQRYFQKAISIDPTNADAYRYLGLIALRKCQKEKAYYLLEHAFKLGKDRKLKRELKTIYQKEFIAFLNKKNEKEEELSTIIMSLENEIKSLKEQTESLKSRNNSISKKVKETKAKTGVTIRKTRNDMESQMEEIQSNYEKQIVDLEQAMEVEEIQKESNQRKMLRLTLEIMEAKSQKQKQSFNDVQKQVETILGTDLWMRMSKEARSYLTTAEHAFSMLDKNSVETDFSLVGMELCKALETEINHKLVWPFVNKTNGETKHFLSTNKISEIKGLPVYFTMLAKVADTQNYPEITHLTLGQYLFALKKTLEGEYALDAYGNYLENMSESSGIAIGRKFLQKLKIVTNGYRNSIVHYTHMDFQQCVRLRELIFLKNDSLLVACCKAKKNFG